MQMFTRQLLVLVLALIVLFFLILFISRTGEVPEMNVSKKLEGNATIGVLSDTHVPKREDRIPKEVINTFKEENVDLIIHAGDLVSQEVIGELEEVAKVKAVKGNMDKDMDLPKTTAVKVNKFKIGVIHNTLNPLSDKMMRTAEENDLDMIIFGHTHRNVLEKRKGIWFLNPGSPTDPLFDKASFGLLDINGRKISPKIIELE